MIRRIIDRILSEGQGRQLAWLAGIALALFLILVLAGSFWALGWTEILNLYLDPGSYPLEAKSGSQGTLNFFSLLIAFGGILVLNALTVSAFSNVFDNISEKYRKGERRYRFKGHVLILGGGRKLEDMLRELQKGEAFAGRNIVVMSSSDIETLRENMEATLEDRRFCRRISWYRGGRDNPEDLQSCLPGNAVAIYIIGEDEESRHDSISIRSLELLSQLCKGQGPAIPCFLTLKDRLSSDILNYIPRQEGSRLRAELINTDDYICEQLLVDTDFIPVPRDGNILHIVISGSGSIAEAFALVAAQICHFPAFATSGVRTRISFINEGIRSRMDEFIAAHQNLFDLCHYRYVADGHKEKFSPSDGLGDFLDIEWEFIDNSIYSPFTRQMLEDWAADAGQETVVAICGEEPEENLAAAIRLPKSVHKAGIPIAVYMNGNPDLLYKAEESGMYGNLRCFGEATPGNDALLLERSLHGKRVNRVYDKEYGNPPAANADDAWASLSFAHKLSSIASANSIPLKIRTFHLDQGISDATLAALSEVEHRRWMITALLLGYSAAPTSERSDRSRFKELKEKEFIHLDIAPWEELGTEADKDTLIVKDIPYIINGEE